MMPTPRTINSHDLRPGDILAQGGAKVLDVFVYVVVEETGGNRKVVTYRTREKVMVRV